MPKLIAALRAHIGPKRREPNTLAAGVDQGTLDSLVLRELAEDPPLREWIDRPALSRVSASIPEIVRRLN